MTFEKKIDHLYWILKFGIPKRKISAEEFYSSTELLKNPVFFLSTGRCGTEWFTHLLSNAGTSRVFHAPQPNLSIQNKFIFEQYQTKPDQIVNQIAKQILLSGREQFFRYAYKTEKRYIETNNHITFFAPAIQEIFPTAKFVHLYRHPGDFVTSGMRRGWFDNNYSANEKLIIPVGLNQEWESYGRVQKIGWVWSATNQFIEDFKSSISPDKCFSLDFSSLNPNSIKLLVEFLDVKVTASRITRNLKIKRNQQKNGNFPSYRNWLMNDKEMLKEVCQVLAKKYNYEL